MKRVPNTFYAEVPDSSLGYTSQYLDRNTYYAEVPDSSLGYAVSIDSPLRQQVYAHLYPETSTVIESSDSAAKVPASMTAEAPAAYENTIPAVAYRATPTPSAATAPAPQTVVERTVTVVEPGTGQTVTSTAPTTKAAGTATVKTEPDNFTKVAAVLGIAAAIAKLAGLI